MLSFVLFPLNQPAGCCTIASFSKHPHVVIGSRPFLTALGQDFHQQLLLLNQFVFQARVLAPFVLLNQTPAVHFLRLVAASPALLCSRLERPRRQPSVLSSSHSLTQIPCSLPTGQPSTTWGQPLSRGQRGAKCWLCSLNQLHFDYKLARVLLRKAPRESHGGIQLQGTGDVLGRGCVPQ